MEGWNGMGDWKWNERLGMEWDNGSGIGRLGMRQVHDREVWKRLLSWLLHDWKGSFVTTMRNKFSISSLVTENPSD